MAKALLGLKAQHVSFNDTDYATWSQRQSLLGECQRCGDQLRRRLVIWSTINRDESDHLPVIVPVGPIEGNRSPVDDIIPTLPGLAQTSLEMAEARSPGG